MRAFTQFLAVEYPEKLSCNEAGGNPTFEITFSADNEIPFPQVILHGQGIQKLINHDAIRLTTHNNEKWTYSATVPADLLRGGTITIQVEGCQKADLSQAVGSDWIKTYHTLRLIAPPQPIPQVHVSESSGAKVKVYFGIHKHMHQPYYNTTDRSFWDGEKDDIFGSRVGNYTDFIAAAVRQYIDGDLPHGGLSTSWSGSLIEQLDRCSQQGLCGDRFANWNASLREIAREKTALGNPRVAFSAFGFYHPLMPLIPSRDIVKQISWHRHIIRDAFGVDPSPVLFPPETAFHVRMIPALVEAGVTAVIYDSVHRFRACQDYPYGGIGEGMLPPNQSEQINPPVSDWLQLQNIWAGSKISPGLLRPEYISYQDPEGQIHKIIAIPAERYIGNEDARGGFGALLYPEVLGQVYQRIANSGNYDPKYPPFFLLHSDGDNHGGGADSYYKHNTGQLVQWLQQDPRFELITTDDYLQQFPPDSSNSAHIEPGSWSGADNGDPQFMKWFSRYEQAYSPDLNSWAVLTAWQNIVHTLEDNDEKLPTLVDAQRLLLTAETSCYWYWTGQSLWDQQVTNAANQGYNLTKSSIDKLLAKGSDRTGPTIFAPWVMPENPGGKRWGQGCLLDAAREGVVHTFICDISGLKRVTLVIRTAQGETTQAMDNHGPYPSQTGALVTADYCTARLPVGAGDVRYYIEAEDTRGNISISALERVFLG